MIADIAEAKTLPDADLEFLVGVETVILQKLREPVDAMSGASEELGGLAGSQAQSLPPPSMGGGMGGGGMGGAAPPGGISTPPGAPGSVPGVTTMPSLPNPDELRRMMG